MSEMEHDQRTEEMFEVVNSHASDESKRQADLVAKKVLAAENATAQAKQDRERTTKRAKTVMALILRLLICTVAAALFVAALLLPSWVPVLCCAGIGACLIVGTIVTDRCIRSWR